MHERNGEWWSISLLLKLKEDSFWYYCWDTYLSYFHGVDKKAGTANPNVAIVSSAELRDIRGKAEKGSVNNAAIITRAELDRIKAETVIKSVEQIKAEKKMLNA